MQRGLMASIAVAMLLARGARPAAAGAQTLADARITVSTDRPTFLLGENVLVHYCLENRSSVGMTIEVGGDSRGASRSQRFKVVVTNESGVTMADPDPSGFHFGGALYKPLVNPGDRWCQSLPLMRYARIPDPGRYSVRVAHDLGWTVKPLPGAEAAVSFTMPGAGEAARVIAALMALPEEQRDFSTLRYPVYLPALVRLVEGGPAAAVTGIGAMPSPDATRALIALMKHSDRAIARGAARQLAMRLPDPALEGRLPRP